MTTTLITFRRSLGRSLLLVALASGSAPAGEPAGADDVAARPTAPASPARVPASVAREVRTIEGVVVQIGGGARERSAAARKKQLDQAQAAAVDGGGGGKGMGAGDGKGMGAGGGKGMAAGGGKGMGGGGGKGMGGGGGKGMGAGGGKGMGGGGGGKGMGGSGGGGKGAARSSGGADSSAPNSASSGAAPGGIAGPNTGSDTGQSPTEADDGATRTDGAKAIGGGGKGMGGGGGKGMGGGGGGKGMGGGGGGKGVSGGGKGTGGGGKRMSGGGGGRGTGGGRMDGQRNADSAAATTSPAAQGTERDRRNSRGLRRGQVLLEVDGTEVVVDLGRQSSSRGPALAVGDRLSVTGSEGRGGQRAFRATRVVRNGEVYDIPSRGPAAKMKSRPAATTPAASK